jgi:hypothetical protein
MTEFFDILAQANFVPPLELQMFLLVEAPSRS